MPKPSSRVAVVLLLALWLLPQLLLAGHAHWEERGATPDCSICLQSSAATPALDTAVQAPIAAALPVAIDFSEMPAIVSHGDATACRDPPL